MMYQHQSSFRSASLGSCITWLGLLTVTFNSSLFYAAAQSCLGSSAFSIKFIGECSYSTLVKKVGSMMSNTCALDAGEELDALLGASSRADARDAVDTLCQSGYTDFKNDMEKTATFQTEALPDTPPESEGDEAGTWVKVFGKGSLAGETQSSLWEQGSSFLSQSLFYIKRECPSCSSTAHKTIIYKRITPVPSGLDIKNLMLDDWFNSPSNNLNVDFKLYSSMTDALADTNAWTYCNYNDAGVGFPRDCGPTGSVADMWNSLSDVGQSDVAFYVYDVPTVTMEARRKMQVKWPTAFNEVSNPKCTERLRTALLFSLMNEDTTNANGLYFVSTNMDRITNMDCAKLDLMETWTFNYSPSSAFSASLDESIIQRMSCDGSTQNDALRTIVTNLAPSRRRRELTASDYFYKDTIEEIAGSGTMAECGLAVDMANDDYTTTLLITPTEDTFVKNGASDGTTNYGSETRLSVKAPNESNANSRTALIRFDLGSINAACAKLKLFVKDITDEAGGTSSDITVKRLASSSADWLESHATADNTLPLNIDKVGSTITLTTDEINTWVEFDVTDLLEGVTTSDISLVLEASTVGGIFTKFASREGFKNQPYLEINPDNSCFDMSIADDAIEFDLLYKLDIPTMLNVDANGIDYEIDNSQTLASTEDTFQRVAYKMVLESSLYGTQGMWVSFDAHTTFVSSLGVPTSTSATFQEQLSNMNVISTISSLNGQNLNGNIEFWYDTYRRENSAAVAGASDAVYDWGDEPSGSGSYGSMQVHSSDLSSTLFAMSRFSRNGPIDIGIGNNPTTDDLDWTFMQNGGDYSKKELSVYVSKARTALGWGWVKVFGKGTLAGDADSSPWEQGSDFLTQSVFYIMRECPSCSSTAHKTIIYKRITPVPSGLDIKNLMLDDWFNSESNSLNVHFKLYGSMADALADTNAWTSCNYNDAGVGFPRDCGPSGNVGGQWNSLTRGGQANVAFYVYNSFPLKQASYKSNPCQDLPNGLCSECSGDCDADSDCDGDLRCMHRNTGTNIPSCDSSQNPELTDGSTDFCFLPKYSPGFANYVGECSSDGSYLCGACEGDCDDDSDCEGDLVCFQRSGSEAVPGCEGEGGALDLANKDICYDPSA